MADPSQARRIPQQARSRKRYDLILDAAAELFAEIGYEATTTNAIAAHADISIGSLYQYFPAKEAILNALAGRYLEELRRLHDEVFTPDVEYLPLPVMLDRLIDPFITFQRRYPGFAHIFVGSDLSASLAAAAAGMDQEVVEQIKKLLQIRNPAIEEQEAYIVATVIKAVVKTLLSLLDSSDDADFAGQVTHEMKQLLARYVEPLLPDGEAGVTGGSGQ